MNFHSDTTATITYNNASKAKKRDEVEFFDKIAEKWDSMEVKSTPTKVRYILSCCGIGHGESVLDLGTGTGVLIPYLYERAGADSDVMAVDFSGKMLEIARRKYDGISPALRFLRADIEADSIPGRYDHIMLYCVYPHLADPAGTLRRLIRENLNPGGKIWIAFPADASFINTIHAEKRSEADRLPSASELALRLLSAGLKASMVEDSPEAYIVRLTA